METVFAKGLGDYQWELTFRVGEECSLIIKTGRVSPQRGGQGGGDKKEEEGGDHDGLGALVGELGRGLLLYKALSYTFIVAS